ncbi:hypothetical protein [Hansschlegelia sp.]|uniref:hypothetical protein n=1 Tax=Hansschlegelia sp. TaxID=2041892 RepID=UPI002B888ECA|nr:hypothetical protein [Hansschlegelia sp.]HVI30345.1 hypothetical protein [Hansschlegelia sp.]
MANGRVRALVAWIALALSGAVAGSPALAASATVSAVMAPEGYARIAFAFDRLPRHQTRLVSNVLVVSFDETVDVDLAPISRALGSIVSVVRRDPDGAAVRMALSKTAKIDAKEAGDTLFVDLLPPSWVGMPPPLPKDVIAALSQEAREGRQIKAEEERRRFRPLAPLTVSGATHPTFRRLIFSAPEDVPVTFKRVGDRVAVTISADVTFDVAAARAKLPPELPLDVSRGPGSLTVYAPAPEGRDVRGFRDDGAFVLDIDRSDAAQANGAGDLPPLATALKHAAENASAAMAPPPPDKPEQPAGKTDVGEARPETPAPAQSVDSAAQEAAGRGQAAAAQTAAPAPAPEAAGSQQEPSATRVGETLRLVFPFGRPTPAAIFRRGASLWAIFDDPKPLDLSRLLSDSRGVITAADQTPLDGGRAVRFELANARLVTAGTIGSDWVVSLGEDLLSASAAIELKPAFGRDGRAAVEAEAPGLGAIHMLRDPEIGDTLAVATLSGPSRNVDRPRQFVEFSALATAQGVAIALIADDLRVTGDLDRLRIWRDEGLALSSDVPAMAAAASPGAGAAVLSAAAWAEENGRPFAQRENELMRAAAMASPESRTAARLALAQFYQLRGRSADSMAVLGAVLTDDPAAERDPRVPILRAAAEIELGRPETALAMLSRPQLAANPEAALWRAEAEADAGRSGPAREALRRGAPALAALPAVLRGRFLEDAAALALDAGDAPAAAAEFERLAVLPSTRSPGARELLRARLAEAMGQTERALAAYKGLIRGSNPAAAAEAELRAVELRLRLHQISESDAIVRLERLAAGWRGDWIEAETLARLIDLYGRGERWRDAFSTLRIAVEAFPDAESSRSLQDKMQERFTELFLGGGVDRMSKLDALALFYDFKELSPGGKRGDELVRRLADKLVEVDLLDQAAELLNYQIENRLTGAARAQVAARAALVSLMNGKPAEAVEVLRKTRQADLPASLVRGRLILEARALAATGRTDLALEMAESLSGAEAQQLKADVLWSARRWAEAGEAAETLLGSAWRAPEPLAPEQRAQVLRAAVALSLAGDALGVDRVRQKFGSKMADSSDAATFEVVTAPINAHGDAFREIARSIASSAAFDAFLKEYRRRASEDPADAAPVRASASAATPSRA